MRVAILTPTFFPFSGIDRLVEEQAKRLAKKGDSVDVYTLRASLHAGGFGLHVIGMPSNPFFERLYRLLMFLDFWKVKKYAKEISEYDIVISHLYPMTILANKAKKMNMKIRYIYYNAGVGIVPEYSLFERIYLKTFNFLNNLMIKNCDSAVSISDFLRMALLKETGINSKVEYVPVDKERFKDADGEKVRKKYGIKDEKVLLYVGRISPHKGVHLLIEAFKMVQKEIPNAKLIIVGKHTFRKYSKKLEKKGCGGVIFAGAVPDDELPDYYGACDVYATASLWEGFDIPIVEAYYSGKPTVAFDIGAHPEVLKKGILVKARDIAGFAKAVAKVLGE